MQNVSDEEIKQNLIANPIKPITESEFFLFNREKQELIFSPELWLSIGCSAKNETEKFAIRDLQGTIAGS